MFTLSKDIEETKMSEKDNNKKNNMGTGFKIAPQKN